MINLPITVSSSGRADFLNTHQDYKGLPVVPVGIDLRMHLFAQPRRDKVFNIKSLNLERLNEQSTDSFSTGINEMIPGQFFGNYLRGVVNTLVKLGFAKRILGMDIRIDSEIPVGSGLSSSAALEVGFTELLNKVCNLELTKKEIAEISYAAENHEVGIPCGRLDQYGVAFGGIIKLDCRSPYNVEPLPFKDLIFAIIDSGIRHSTVDIHPKRQEEINRGLEVLMENLETPEFLKKNLGRRFDEPRWELIEEKNLQGLLSIMDNDAKRRILFTIRMNCSTEFGLKVLRKQWVSKEEIKLNLGEEVGKTLEKTQATEASYLILGEIMTKQHYMLRDLYDLSLPELEDICIAALDAGAYGAKISGAGMGGSIIALVKDDKVGKKVVDACLMAGGKAGWVSKVGEGVRIETPRKMADQLF